MGVPAKTAVGRHAKKHISTKVVNLFFMLIIIVAPQRYDFLQYIIKNIREKWKTMQNNGISSPIRPPVSDGISRHWIPDTTLPRSAGRMTALCQPHHQTSHAKFIDLSWCSNWLFMMQQLNYHDAATNTPCRVLKCLQRCRTTLQQKKTDAGNAKKCGFCTR